MNQEKEKSQIIVIVSAGDRKGRPYKRARNDRKVLSCLAGRSEAEESSDF